jgi:L-alanine-DL-glutamate epimerase-like enolase superfamily enzyme
VKITGMKTHILAIDSTLWYGGAPVPTNVPVTWHYPFTIVSTDEGIDGWTMGYGANSEGRGTAYQLHDVYLPAILGKDPLCTEALWQELMDLNRHLYPISDGLLGMLDVAFWDIKGKAANQSIGALLGLYRDHVPSYRTGSHYNNTPEKVYIEAQAMKQEGYHGYKLSLWDGPARDIPRCRAAREAVGPDFKLMLDAVSNYNFTQALEMGRALMDLGYYWFEEPIPDRQMGQLKRLTEELSIPILATETVSLRELPQYLQQHTIDLARGDVFIKAGITGLRKAAAMCDILGFNIEIHTLHSPLLDIANLHVACSIENSEFVESHNPMFRFGLKNTPLDIDSDGCQVLPSGPGLGVELDWDWIENHTVTAISGVTA